MSKTQFWILNVAGVVCAALVLTAMVFGRQNDRVIRELEANQTKLNRAQQIQLTGRNLAARIAQAAASEPALRELALRHDLSTNAPPKP